MSRKYCTSLSCGIILIGYSISLAQNIDPMRVSDSSQNERQIQLLVQKLGDPQFKIREQTSAKLKNIGMAAIPALKEVSESTDQEVYSRSRWLIKKIYHQEYHQRVKRFSQNPSSKPDDYLPLLKRFRQIVGKTKSAHRFYQQILQAEPNLYFRFWTKDKNFDKIYQSRCQQIQSTHLFQNTQLPVEQLCSLILLDSYLETETHQTYILSQLIQRNSQLKTFKADSMVLQALLDSKNQTILKIVADWTKQTVGIPTNELIYKVHLSKQLKIRSGITPALQMIRDSMTPMSSLRECVVLVSMFSESKHVPELETFFNDQRVLERQNESHSEIRDLMLANCVVLTNQKLADYEFSQLKSEVKFKPFRLYIHSAGFLTSAKRQAAFQKWKRWKATQKK